MLLFIRNFLFQINIASYLPALKTFQYFPGDKRPVWYVFAGMGSQWPTMGKALMRIPKFSEIVNKCHQTLKPTGVDLIRIITSNDPKTFDNILNSFVGIAAIQVRNIYNFFGTKITD